MKQDWKPGTMVYPLPAVLVSCGDSPENYNLITVAWTGTLCTNPPMCYISVRPERHSYDLIRKNMEFVIVINLTTEDLAYATDWCGVRSGRDYHKFEEMKLTPGPARMVKAPIVEESPLCIECRVKEIISLGSHDLFLADVLNVKPTRNISILRPENGRSRPAIHLCICTGDTINWVKKSGSLAGASRRKRKFEFLYGTFNPLNTKTHETRQHRL